METQIAIEMEAKIVFIDNWVGCLSAWLDRLNGLNATAVVTVVTANSLGIITVNE